MKMMRSSWSSTMFKVLFIAALPTHVWTYKILLVPWIGKSHVFSMSAIAEGLVNRGHNVTFFVAENFPQNHLEFIKRAEISLVRYKDTPDGVHMDYDAMGENHANSAIDSGGNVKEHIISIMSKVSQDWCHQITLENDDRFETLEREKFDIAVVDELVFTKCMYLIPHRLQIPWITYTVAVDPLTVRVPWIPSFVPTVIVPFTEQMTFIERLRNTAASFFVSFVMSLYFPDPDQEVLDKYRRYGYFASLDELVSKTAVWFLRNDYILNYPRPMMPNMVDIAGLTVKRSTGQLPPDIRNFIDSAKKGVILMTFGSIASEIPAYMVEKFSLAFQRLDGYRVIWRLNNKDNVKLPDNVMIGQWLPQNDILAQPSVKLFITHCGNNGQYEAIYHGVPMIGFPVLGDQQHNAKRLDYKGYGLSMDLYDFTADQLLENINIVLEDKSYKDRITKASEIFRSQAQSPVERATFWIEHVCRFGGDHLRSAGNDLPLYSYLMLDVLAFILIILHILVYLLYRLIKLIISKCCRYAASDNTLKKNN